MVHEGLNIDGLFKFSSVHLYTNLQFGNQIKLLNLSLIVYVWMV